MTKSGLGFGWGAGLGAAIAIGAMLMIGEPTSAGFDDWVSRNLGYSVWPFAAVLAAFGLNLNKLGKQLDMHPDLKDVVALDQLSDVWIHLFVGIGVIWTAIGMRSALQTALGDPGAALVDSAGSVLQKLVDGGILLALTTTIVGGVGGYLMRLVKTVTVGPHLQAFYDASQRIELTEIEQVTKRIEARLSLLFRPRESV